MFSNLRSQEILLSDAMPFINRIHAQNSHLSWEGVWKGMVCDDKHSEIPPSPPNHPTPHSYLQRFLRQRHPG